ncbi:hypothetical protein H6P81_009042 [Aristolochia fimbriata]|uniref:Uncharacterized protein n=1 Tax=Aristolochia fimbriata TaxID=158543 RepID=A0AAV7EJQ4_ARIFI|nr:hypothetical protein H6P81_009042 [Aristolochia fimbriata]
MASATKKRKTEPFHRPGKTGECARQQKTSTPSPGAIVGKVPTSSSGSPVVAPALSPVDSKVQQAKIFAVAQAQRDGCTGNFRSFNSHFGNYLLPVIPTLADLNQ